MPLLPRQNPFYTHRGVSVYTTAGVHRFRSPRTGEKVVVGQRAGGKREVIRLIDEDLDNAGTVRKVANPMRKNSDHYDIPASTYDALKPGTRIELGIHDMISGRSTREFEVGRTSHSKKYNVYSKTIYPLVRGEPRKIGMKFTLYKRGTNVSLALGDMGATITSFRVLSGGGVKANGRRKNGWGAFSDKVTLTFGTDQDSHGHFGGKRADEVIKLAKKHGGKGSKRVASKGSAMYSVTVTFDLGSWANSHAAAGAFNKDFAAWNEKRKAANVAFHHGGPDPDTLDLANPRRNSVPSWAGADKAYSLAYARLEALNQAEYKTQLARHVKAGRAKSTFRYSTPDEVRDMTRALDRGDEEAIKAFNLMPNGYGSRHRRNHTESDALRAIERAQDLVDGPGNLQADSFAYYQGKMAALESDTLLSAGTRAKARRLEDELADLRKAAKGERWERIGAMRSNGRRRKNRGSR